MTLHQIRRFAQDTISALHDAGLHYQAWELSGYLYEAGYRPSESQAQFVLEAAQLYTAQLSA